MTAAPLPRALPAIAVTAVGAALAWGLRHQGGYRRWQFEPFIGLLLVGVVVGIFATRPWLGPRRLLVAAVFLTPMLASALWNGPVAVRGCSGPLALALGVLGALHLGGQIEGRTRHVLVGLVLGSGVIVAGTSWWGVAFRRYRWALEADGLWRGSSVLTYANSTAALLVALALAVAAIVAGTRAATVRGSAWRLLLFVLLVGAGATQSRAAALAGIVGAAVLASLQRRKLCRAVPTVLAAVVATAGVIASSPVAAERRPTLALATLALGAALVVIPAWLAIPVRGCWDPRVRSTSAVLFGLLATAAIVIGASQLLPEAFLQSRVSAASPQSGATDGGAAAFLGDRAPAWSAAVAIVKSHPWLGVGPGRLRVAWVSEDGQIQRIRYVHNEYLEYAATYGLLGVVGLAAGAVMALRCAVRLRRRTADPPPHAAGALAALAAFAAHSSFDYLWHQPLVPVVVSLLVGLGLGTPSVSLRAGSD